MAPNSLACSSLKGTGSTATTCRAPASGHAAADEGCFVERDVGLDLDAAGLAHHRVGLERSEAAHDPEVVTIFRVVPGGEVGDLPAGHQEGAEIAEILATHGA